jgi:hypothetical protein
MAAQPITRVAFRVTGMKDKKFSDVATVDPSRFTNALEASIPDMAVQWDSSGGLVTISYNAQSTTAEELAAVITDL